MSRALLIGAPFVLLPAFYLTSDVIFPSLNQDSKLTIFLAIWMVCWWIFEIMPLGVTALLPLIYLPILNIQGLKDVAKSYSNPVIYLFLGGFIIARALEKTGLSRRIA